MSAGILRYVVDASVGIKLFVEESDSEKAHQLFAQLTVSPPVELFIPDLFYIECANILLKYSLRFGRPLKHCRADLADLGKLALRSVSTADLMEGALVLAAQSNLTAYDACYAILAEQLGIPLLTADKQMAREVKRAVLLEDFE